MGHLDDVGRELSTGPMALALSLAVSQAGALITASRFCRSRRWVRSTARSWRPHSAGSARYRVVATYDWVCPEEARTA